jgi:hypothetical protein
MLKFCLAKQEPVMIGNHLVVCQEKTTNAFLVRPLIVKIFFIVHFLNVTFQYQPVLDADFCDLLIADQSLKIP